jgi:hypothetical protein
MRAPWHEGLRPLCADARDLAGTDAPEETVLFFVARWCQKETGATEPDVAALHQDLLADVAARIVRNLDDDGARVDRLVAGDAGAWSELRRLLHASACTRADAAADEYADEALQKIAIVLLTGTPPSRAVAQLAQALEGPRNEYVFTSPFPFWARTVVINLIVDDKRRQTREREAPPVQATRKADCLDATTIGRAHEALPALLDAIGALPPVQRSVMAWTLARRGLDSIVIERLRDMAPDLFAETVDRASVAGVPDTAGAPATDADIAARLGTTARLVAANRSVVRCNLSARDPYWKLLLDVLLPHKSTRRSHEEDHDG